MSRYIIPLQVDDKEYEIVIGHDYQTKSVFWSAMELGSEPLLLDTSASCGSIDQFLHEQIGVDLQQVMGELSIPLEDLLDEDSNYGDLRREFSAEEITKLGFQVVDPNRIMTANKITLSAANKPAV